MNAEFTFWYSSHQNTFWAEVFGREFARCCHFLGESTGHLHTSHSWSKSFDSVPLDGNKSDTATCSWCSMYLPESLSPSVFALLVTSIDRTRIYSFEENRKAWASSIWRTMELFLTGHTSESARVSAVQKESGAIKKLLTTTKSGNCCQVVTFKSIERSRLSWVTFCPWREFFQWPVQTVSHQHSKDQSVYHTWSFLAFSCWQWSKCKKRNKIMTNAKVPCSKDHFGCTIETGLQIRSFHGLSHIHGRTEVAQFDLCLAQSHQNLRHNWWGKRNWMTSGENHWKSSVNEFFTHH